MTAIVNSQEETIGDTDKIIEGVTESKKVFSVLCTSIIQIKGNSEIQRQGKWLDNMLATGGSKDKGREEL